MSKYLKQSETAVPDKINCFNVLESLKKKLTALLLNLEAGFRQPFSGEMIK